MCNIIIFNPHATTKFWIWRRCALYQRCNHWNCWLRSSEPVVHRCSVKRVFLKISQNSQENRPETCNFIKKETVEQVFSCEFHEIFKNTFFHRTHLVAASRISFRDKIRGEKNVFCRFHVLLLFFFSCYNMYACVS